MDFENWTLSKFKSIQAQPKTLTLLAWAFVHNLNALGSPESSKSKLSERKFTLFVYLHEYKKQNNMKKFLLIILIACASIANAAQMKHFNININDSIISEEIVSYFSEWFNLPNNTSFVQAKVLTDNNGKLHCRYDQYIGDILVEGGQILVHSHNGYVQDINGVVLERDLEQSPVKNKIIAKKNEKNQEDVVIISINNESEFRYAYKLTSEDLGAHVYIDTENGDTLKVIPFIHSAQSTYTTNTIYYGRRQLTVDTNGKWRFFSTQNPRIETILATAQDFTNASAAFLNNQIQICDTYYEEEKDSINSYLTSIYFELKGDWWVDVEEGVGNSLYPDLYIIIADNYGNYVYQSPVFDNWKPKPNNPTVLSVTFNPMLLLDGSKYTIRLYDEDVLNDDEGSGFTISSTTKGIGTLSTANFDVTINVTGNPVRDAHWGMEKTLAYYKNVFDLDSYDGNGATIYQFMNPVHMGKLPNNAYAITDYPYCIVYGFGDGVLMSPLVALDIVAHEFTHLVTFYKTISGLEYQGESGALNEGFSDIFAILTEGYTNGKYDWLIGEKVFLKEPYFLRSMSNPELVKQPNTYGKGKFWIDPSNTSEENDYGGVHSNSGILNYWFYLLCNGGSGINDNQHSYEVKGIGIDKASEIVYNTWMNRLTGRSTYADARESFIKEVTSNSKYGKGSPEHKAVVNAWHAVGVGDKYVEEPTTSSDQFLVLAQRKTGGNWFYMTADLGTAGTKRFQAIDAGTSVKEDINRTPDGEKYLWSFEDVAGGVALKNGTQYATWNAGNSAILSSAPKAFSVVDAGEDIVNISFVDGDGNTRYLSLNATEGNNYFAFYKGTTQKYNLLIIPYGGQQPPIEEPKEEFVVLAQRNNTSNWFYMTADLGTAGTKRFQAVDAGTPNKSMINTSPTDSKYIWSFEEVAGGIALVNEKQYASWKSGNSAILSTTPMALNITDISDDQVNMSFVDNEGNTRYLSLNATEGNNYFAFYKGTTQKCNLLVIPYGEKITTELETITLTETPIVQKIMRDGQLLILRDGKTYNVMGQEL